MDEKDIDAVATPHLGTPAGTPAFLKCRLSTRWRAATTPQSKPEDGDRSPPSPVTALGTRTSSSKLINDVDQMRRLFKRDAYRHDVVMQQAAKIEIRAQDTQLKKLEFIYEEYEPRVYMFPVFELVRRVFLSAVLTMLLPGTLSQVAIGLLGALVSHRVFTFYSPYIEDADDVVSEVAQTQLVLIYFCATDVLPRKTALAGGLVTHANDLLEQGRGSLSDQVLGYILILIFFSTFAMAVRMVCLSTFSDVELANFSQLAQKVYRSSSDTFRNLNMSFRGSPFERAESPSSPRIHCDDNESDITYDRALCIIDSNGRPSDTVRCSA